MERPQSRKNVQGLAAQEYVDYSFHRVSTYDPNMCSTARLSPPYTNSSNVNFQQQHSYENIILISNENPTVNNQELVQNPLIGERTEQTEFAVASANPNYSQNDYDRCNTNGETNAVFHDRTVKDGTTPNCDDVPAFHMITGNQSHVALSSFQPHDGERHNSKIDGSEIILHRSPNGHLYQNFYVGNEIKESTLVELVQIRNSVDLEQSQYVTYKAEHEPPLEFTNFPTKFNNNELIEQLPGSEFINLESSMITHTTHDEYLREPYTLNSNETNHLNLHDKDAQRLLLESTMSPLLAAVNDITQREAELQSYLNQNLEKESNLALFGEACDIRRNDFNAENASISQSTSTQEKCNEKTNCADDDYLLVADKPVESRARASLPTKYLYFAKSDDVLDEPVVFAKKEISLRTKFGPLEGEICLINDAVLDVLRIQTPRTYPLLILDQNRILEVANENTSNWMRFVRMALTSKEQNVLLYEESGKLFFKCCQVIEPREELRVGYSKEYAVQHGLLFLEVPVKNHDLIEDYSLSDNGEKQKTNENNAETNHGEKIAAAPKSFSDRNRRKRSSLKSTKKLPSIVEPETCETQTNMIYGREEPKETSPDKISIRLQCPMCMKNCSTPTALTAHIRSHTTKHFSCVFCSETYKNVADFKRHVNTHSSNGIFTCHHCKKKYNEYYLVRKHIKIFHTTVKFSCNECSRQFPNMNFLRRHKISHMDKRDFLCSQCGKQFKRKDKLREHVQRMHSEIKNQNNLRKRIKSSKRNILSTKKLSAANNKKADNTKTDHELVDYQRFIYKCADCMLGFKRRGMLVNHMAKRHPEVSLETIPELNQPILKPQSLFYCQYCNKVYKSNAKRKIHILKAHPGAEVPPSLKSNPQAAQVYSRTVGSLSTEPQRCQFCYKQYASRNRLLGHYRKQHSNVNFKNYEQPAETLYVQPPNSPENKLLKLSSAALELSSIEDKKFFDFLNEKSNNSLGVETNQIIENNSNMTINQTNDNANSFSKVGVNFKMIENEFTETAGGELNRLPQLFEESMACI